MYVVMVPRIGLGDIMDSYSRIVKLDVLDNDELELTDINGDISIHHGVIIAIEMDDTRSFTVTCEN